MQRGPDVFIFSVTPHHATETLRSVGSQPWQNISLNVKERRGNWSQLRDQNTAERVATHRHHFSVQQHLTTDTHKMIFTDVSLLTVNITI